MSYGKTQWAAAPGKEQKEQDMGGASLDNRSFVEHTGAILDEDPGLSEFVYFGTGLPLLADAQASQRTHGGGMVSFRRSQYVSGTGCGEIWDFDFPALDCRGMGASQGK